MHFAPKTKAEYIQAQSKLVTEAMAADFCRIEVYPAQNRELWLLDKPYKTIALIYRWLFFSDYLKSGKPEDKVYSVYTFAHLLKRAVKAGKAVHPGRDFVDFAEESLNVMAERGIVDLLVLDNGFLAACISSCSKRTADIQESRERYRQQRSKKAIKRSDDVQFLCRCFDLPCTQ